MSRGFPTDLHVVDCHQSIRHRSQSRGFPTDLHVVDFCDHRIDQVVGRGFPTDLHVVDYNRIIASNMIGRGFPTDLHVVDWVHDKLLKSLRFCWFYPEKKRRDFRLKRTKLTVFFWESPKTIPCEMPA